MCHKIILQLVGIVVQYIIFNALPMVGIYITIAMEMVQLMVNMKEVGQQSY